MPITYQLDHASRRIWTVITDSVTDKDVMSHKEALRAEPAIGPDWAEVTDVRGVERLDVTPAGIRAMTEWDSDTGQPQHRLALVVSKDLAFGLARMYQQSSGPRSDRVGVFRTMEEAEAWLATFARPG